MIDKKTIRDTYFSLLKAHLSNPQEEYLARAAELGRELVIANIPPEDVGEMHEDALQRLGKEFTEAKLIDTANLGSQLLIELLMVYSMTFRELLEEHKRVGEKVKEAGRLREHFLKETSHRIITPVTIIGGCAQLLLESNNLDDAQKRKIRIMQARNEEVQKLVRDALAGKYLKEEEEGGDE